MRRLLFILAVLLPVGASAQWGGGFLAKSHFGPPPPATCQRGSAFVDGCPAAPAGTANLPTLLSSYTTRPPWNVAGVDYLTGPPTGTTFADPATISMTGVTVNTGAHTVTITGNNITLSGYNFGLANGWKVTVNGANDTVQNSLFKVGTNNGALGTVLNVSSSASNFTFQYNEVDGNNIAVTVQAGFTLGFVNTGTLKIQYNYMHNSGGDMVEIQEGNWTNQQIRYNLFRDIGYTTDHSDTIQWCRSVIAAGNMDFNTIYQSQSGLSGEGLLTLNSECPGSNIRNTTVRNNTGISKVQDNFAFGQTITQDAGAAAGDHNATYDNYVDPTGINSFTNSPWFPSGGPGFSPPLPIIGNPSAMHTMTNMLNGANIPVPTTSATQGGYFTYPDGNSYSPCICDIFSISPSPASGNITTGNVITFTLAMDAPTTVTGTPTMTLNSGGTASYVSGSGTKSLAFNYTVGSGDVATTVAVTAISGSMKDDAGNTTLLSPLTNLTTSFTGLSVNSGGSSMAFTALTSAAINTTTPGSGTYTGGIPSGLTNVAYGGACTGSSTVTGFSASGGTWHATFTTPASPCTGTISVTGTGPNTASATSPSTAFTGTSSCPDNDGSSGAPAGTPQLPTLLSGYAAAINGAHGLGCQVAAVDYHVGLPSTTTLVVPTSGNLPAGATISGNAVSINSNNVTFQGFDMTGKSLSGSGRSGTIIQNNKFQATGTCLTPILMQNAGTTTVQFNDITGATGATCPGGYTSGFTGEVNVNPISGATFTYQWNNHQTVNEDAVAVQGPGSGSAAFSMQYNLFQAMGFAGHPDGIQFCGGTFATPVMRHNTYYQPQALLGQIDSQILHVESQCSPTGHITNATVIFNTFVQPGSSNCIAVDIPGTCTSNSTISCKNDDPPSSTNSGMLVYGNYLDWTTSQINIDNTTACTSITIGSPNPNWDMKLGITMTSNQHHP